jgi:hypothetical protein
MNTDYEAQKREDFASLLALYEKLSAVESIDIGLLQDMHPVDEGFSVTLDSGRAYRVAAEVREFYRNSKPKSFIENNAGLGIVTYKNGKAEWYPARLNVTIQPAIRLHGKRQPLDAARLPKIDKNAYEQALAENMTSCDGLWFFCPPVPSGYCLHFNSPLLEMNYAALWDMATHGGSDSGHKEIPNVDFLYTEFSATSYIVIALRHSVYVGDRRVTADGIIRPDL